MTTATAGPPELDEEGLTRKEVESWTERRDEMEARLEELEAREGELSDRMAHLHADGASDEAEQVAAERREVVELTEDLSAALEVLEVRIAEGIEAACRREAAERLQTIRKVCGGIAGEHPRRVERLTEAVEKCEKEVEAMNAAYRRQEALRAEARALADRFDLETPDLKTVLPPDQSPEADDLLERARRLQSDSRSVRIGRRKPPAERARLAARLLKREHGEESPAPELFEMAGEIGEEAWRGELRRRGEVRKQEQAEQKEQRRQTVDRWLRERLSNGPVESLRLRDEAQEADEVVEALEAMPRGHMKELIRASRRVGVVHYRREGDPRSTYWGLRNVDTGVGTPWSERRAHRTRRLG